MPSTDAAPLAPSPIPPALLAPRTTQPAKKRKGIISRREHASLLGQLANASRPPVFHSVVDIQLYFKGLMSGARLAVGLAPEAHDKLNAMIRMLGPAGIIQTESDLKAIVRTFSRAFPHDESWCGHETALIKHAGAGFASALLYFQRDRPAP